MSDDENGADVALKFAGQEVNVKNVKSLNTLATVATLVLVVLLGYAFYLHAADAKDAGKELVSAMKDLAQTNREQNCLIAIPPEQRMQNSDLCKRLSR